MHLLSQSLHSSIDKPVCFVIISLWFCFWVLNSYLELNILVFLKKDCIYLFIFRERGRQGRRKGDVRQCVFAFMHPHWGPGPPPRPVPWLGIKLVTLWFIGWLSIHWATPARTKQSSFLISNLFASGLAFQLILWNSWSVFGKFPDNT